jgi:hypothetical protein
MYRGLLTALYLSNHCRKVLPRELHGLIMTLCRSEKWQVCNMMGRRGRGGGAQSVEALEETSTIYRHGMRGTDV